METAMQSLTGKIAHPATVAIKAAPDSENADAALDAIRRAFGVEEPNPNAALATRRASGDPGATAPNSLLGKDEERNGLSSLSTPLL